MTVGACPLTLIRQVGRRVMPKYVIERDIPGAGKLSPAELRNISQRSCTVLERLGPRISRVRRVIDPTTSEGRGSGR